MFSDNGFPKRLVNGLVSSLFLTLVIVSARQDPAANAQSFRQIPDFQLPYDKSWNEDVLFSGGPHRFGTTCTQAIIPAHEASGIDFSSKYRYDYCDDNCSFVVRAMASGYVIYAGGLGTFGNMVAVRLENDYVIIYGHLYDVWPGIEDAYFNREPYFVVAGSAIGHAGGSGPNGLNQWPIHLHVELRDDKRCSGQCVQDHEGNVIGGNPVPWDSIRIGGYRIFEYHVQGELSGRSYNYDGVAVRSDDPLGPPVFENFAFMDPEMNEDCPNYGTSLNRIGVWTWLPSEFPCSGTGNCEDNS